MLLYILRPNKSDTFQLMRRQKAPVRHFKILKVLLVQSQAGKRQVSGDVIIRDRAGNWVIIILAWL